MHDWRCARCGEVIGVYERLVVTGGHGNRVTSRAAEPDLPYEPGARLHERCYRQGGDGQR
jgi:hypothetical protein